MGGLAPDATTGRAVVGGGSSDGEAKVTVIQHLTIEERSARGKAARDSAALSSHSGWVPAPDRPDPVGLLEAQDATREPDLVPVRHGRMMVSPFTFYRGAAKIMAADLKETPRAGLDVQLCGDAHLSNFGGFASPERTLLFDLNDFDETLPGPFEYDLKRLAASFMIAARNNGHTAADARAASLASATAYREALAQFAEMRTMEIWYSKRVRAGPGRCLERHGGLDEGRRQEAGEDGPEEHQKQVAKAHTRDSVQALSKLAEHVDGRYRIVSQPPIVVPMRDMPATYGYSVQELEHMVHEQFRAYRATLRDDQRHLLERFEVIDMARKVVGVGSVGTRAFIVLLQGRDQQDPLFLQVKEATASVLEDHLPKSRYRQPGERVVQGQRMMQAASDIYLGWTKGGEADRYLYWRQLRDMKASAEVETMGADRARLLCEVLRRDAGSSPCPLRRPGRPRRLSRQEGHLRPVDRRFRAALRRPERAGLPGLPTRHQERSPTGHRRRVMRRSISCVLRDDCHPSGPDDHREGRARNPRAGDVRRAHVST